MANQTNENIVTLHKQLRNHIGTIRGAGKKKTNDARFTVLLCMVFSCNRETLQSWESIESICEYTGFTNKPVLEALHWLEQSKAIYNIPLDTRYGDELSVHGNQKLWLLTGKILLNNQLIDYLYFGEDEKIIQKYNTIIHNTINRPRRNNVTSSPTWSGYVYRLKGVAPYYKIGRSKDPKKRFSTLSVKLPFDVEIIHLIETNNMVTAEKQLHDKYADKRVRGEWFALSDTDISEIKGISRIEAQE